MNRLMDLTIIAALIMCAVVLILFVLDPNVNAEYIHQMELENYR